MTDIIEFRDIEQDGEPQTVGFVYLPALGRAQFIRVRGVGLDVRAECREHLERWAQDVHAGEWPTSSAAKTEAQVRDAFLKVGA